MKARAGIGDGPALEDLTISAAIGFAALIAALFAMGLFSWYYTPVLSGAQPLAGRTDPG